MGDECPRPGTAVFHLTLVVSDHMSTYPVPATMPWPDGPRHRLQYFAPSPSMGMSETGSNPESSAVSARAAEPAPKAVATSGIVMAGSYPALPSRLDHVPRPCTTAFIAKDAKLAKAAKGTANLRMDHDGHDDTMSTMTRSSITVQHERQPAPAARPLVRPIG